MKSLRIVLTAILLLRFAEVGLAGVSVRSAGSVSTGRPKWLASEIVVKFKNEVSEDRIDRMNQRHATAVLHTSPFAGFKRIKVPAGKTAKEMVEVFTGETSVEYAELNYYAYALFVPDDTYYSYQWHLNDVTAGINVEPAWDITAGDPNVIVAVLDTGVAYEDFANFQLAPDLANTLFTPGYDFVNNDEHANDDDGHGTHVAGTLAQSTHNSIGTAGIAFDCNIMPVKVLSRRGVGSYTDIADGIYFAADNGADIINMSLGGASDSTTLRNAVAYAYSQGVTIICAAGNEYEEGNTPSYPAAYDEYSIAVGATRFDRTRAYYSNAGSYLDLVAPGGDLYIDQNGDGYDDGILQQTFGTNPKDWGYWFYQGTSMAAPHVSGTAALLVSMGVTGPDAVREALQNTARDLGPAGWDQEYGWGLVDAYAALNYGHIPGDFDRSGRVDFDDLAMLTFYWLESEASVDIAPEGGDGIIDMLDFAKLAEGWD
ncbi:MAG: S8 family serine peptidase [Planctomycetota bacterium]|jgi:serine protease